MNEFDDRAKAQPDDAGYADRDAYMDDGLAGVPLSMLVFACAEHDEEMVVEYYDPDDPPRCSHGDPMKRKAR
jgi:hypothetical protein